MNKIFHFFNKYALDNLPIIVFISLTILFIITAFLNIGIFTDNVYTLVGLMQNINFVADNRIFENYISNFFTLVAMLLDIRNVNILVILHGFSEHFSKLFLLFISYMLFPKRNKELFLFPLLSYLITINISSAFIASESFVSAGLYWIIIVPILFEDFNTISYKKLLVMILATFFMIKGYQLDLIFKFLFVLLSLNIFIKIKENRRKYIFAIFILITIFSLSYDLYSNFFASTYFENDYTLSVLLEIIDSNFLKHLIIILLLISALLYLLIKNQKTKTNKLTSLTLIFIIFGYLIIINFIYSLAAFRILNHILPILLSFIMYIIYKRNIDINIKYLKLLNFILLITFIFNFTCISIKWNNNINDMRQYLENKEGLLNFDNFKTNLFEPPYHLYNILSIIIQKQKGISEIKVAFKPPKNMPVYLCLPHIEKYEIYYSDKLIEDTLKNKFRPYSYFN